MKNIELIDFIKVTHSLVIQQLHGARINVSMLRKHTIAVTTTVTVTCSTIYSGYVSLFFPATLGPT